jgi:hypothetical protein
MEHASNGGRPVNVSFLAPLQRAWGRMERMLFRPFRIETWLVMGFAAFLSEMMSGGTGGGGHTFNWHRGHGEWGRSVGRRVWAFLHDPAMLVTVVVGAAVAVVIVLVLQWVSCRGRFIFLDNVVRERAAIVEPWGRFARQGNSLFLWTLFFCLACMVAALVVALPFLVSLRALWEDGTFHWAGLLSLLGFVAMAVPVAIAVAYTLLFLHHFVVPIMYRDGLSATAAWGRFLALLRTHPVSFIVYGLVMIVLWLVIGLAVMVVGFSTCCVGFVLLVLPWVSQVLLLPVLVTIRAFGPQFLAQFGPEFDVFAAAPAPPAPPAPPPGPAA